MYTNNIIKPWERRKHHYPYNRYIWKDVEGKSKIKGIFNGMVRCSIKDTRMVIHVHPIDLTLKGKMILIKYEQNSRAKLVITSNQQQEIITPATQPIIIMTQPMELPALMLALPHQTARKPSSTTYIKSRVQQAKT